MISVLLIVGTVASAAAAWGANLLWVQWEQQYHDEHLAPPPGGDASGYMIVVGAFLAVSVFTTNLALWIG
jgi:hypothetical protein